MILLPTRLLFFLSVRLLAGGWTYREGNRNLSGRGGPIGGKLTKKKEQGTPGMGDILGRDMGTAWFPGNSPVRDKD